MKKYLFINPDDILSFSLINECINNKDGVYILFNIKKDIGVNDILNTFLKKFGYNKFLEDNISLIEYIPFKKNKKLNNYSFDRIIYVNPYCNIEYMNKYYLSAELYFKNIVYICSKYFPDTDFVYVDLINNINFTNKEYLIFKKYSGIIKKYIKKYNIYLTKSILYLDNGYIDSNNIFLHLIKKVFYLNAINHLFRSMQFNFINVKDITSNILYDNIEDKTILLKNNDYTIFNDIITNTKFNYNINELNNVDWNKKNYVCFKSTKIKNYKYLKDINIEIINEENNKLIEYNCKFNINNTLIYLQLNDIIPLYSKKKNYYLILNYICISGIFLFVLLTITLYLFFKSNILKYLLFVLCLLSLVPIKCNYKLKNIIKEKFLEIMDINHKFLIIDYDIEKYDFDNKNYIYLFNPHDIIPTGIHLQILSLEKYKLCHRRSIFFMYKFASYFPFVKQMTSLFDFKNVDYNNIVKCLNNNKNAVLYLGGFDEGVLNLDNTQNKSLISIKNRTGIFKLSLMYGVDIIPVYLFFNKNIYSSDNNNTNLIFKRLLQIINLFIYKPTMTIVGKPIKVNKISNPTEDEIINLRNTYINSLKLLYEKYKIIYNWSDKEIDIY